MPGPTPRPPVVIENLLPDPGLVRRLIERHAPYRPVQRYFASAAEQRALSVSAKAPAVGPVFRGDWAYDRPLVDGVEPILANERFAAAARAVFDAAIVRPQIVYVNLSLPMPCGDGGHTDVPAFRGVERTAYPIWLLVTMGRSGLFDRWRIPIATGVSWFYDGPGGEFTYWPDGPDRAPVVRPMRTNTAVVGDNDVMFHRVEAIGAPDATPIAGLGLDSLLVFAGAGTWEVVDDGQVLARHGVEDVRISVSWKAQVFHDEAEAHVADDHHDDLTLAQVLDTFLSDLRARDVDATLPSDPLHDPTFIAALTTAYRQTPTVYPRPRGNPA